MFRGQDRTDYPRMLRPLYQIGQRLKYLFMDDVGEIIIRENLLQERLVNIRNVRVVLKECLEFQALIPEIPGAITDVSKSVLNESFECEKGRHRKEWV
ncbi:hypothetical protein CEXT_813681 [Caerostris extrusa]|uniref:Uncharacterized protein n=1 Tax=Caerostris extrusa TaxID=172846 RepID=A0AAV4VGJ5_CAEEX|nr:hypothetical protein CEXT_813681 [Caerostris extrusa]